MSKDGCLNCPLLPVDERVALRHIRRVKEEGFGEVHITIQDGVVKYSKLSIGEQAEMDLK